MSNMDATVDEIIIPEIKQLLPPAARRQFLILADDFAIHFLQLPLFILSSFLFAAGKGQIRPAT